MKHYKKTKKGTENNSEKEGGIITHNKVITVLVVVKTVNDFIMSTNLITIIKIKRVNSIFTNYLA